ncbi:TPA: dihydroorotate dehydrogenase electron transfer subunit, partial [Candidatus Bathyarchaeota archaeon]|nr:dihydroorotate dehydrogenase electron transfer subunit [Candidatus Bathyarchaeota archaeon]
TGIAPLIGAIERLARSRRRAKVILGAESKAELLFLRKIEEAALTNPSLKFIPVTEDGSYGVKGDVAAAVESEAARGFRGQILTCGPEPMIRKILKFCAKRKIPLQASLERVMRCGIGLCGSCDVAGFRVCKDGPVFDLQALNLMVGELGAYKRDLAGKLVKI